MRKIFLLSLMVLSLSVHAHSKHKHHKPKIHKAHQVSKVQRIQTPAPTVFVYNNTLSKSVVTDNVDVVRPMASITKLTTAMVSLDHYNLTDKIPLDKKNSITVEQAMTKLLVRSDNSMAELLARNYPGGRDKFLEAMNTKARSLNLSVTRFNDPSGLDAGNVTNAAELAHIVTAAGRYPFITRITSQPEVASVYTVKNKTRTVSLPNTNRTILFEFDNILVSKTGFTSHAGRCLAMLVDNRGEQYAIIILGEPSKQARDQVARNLIQLSEHQ
jgi:D-alanyl-D-alanine endopeptidase (penicillin-binding protein 7)